MYLHDRWLTSALLCIGLVSCQKNITTGPALPGPDTKTTSSIIVGLPPAVVWWYTGPNLPFSDGEPGDIPSGDLYPIGFAINGKGYVCGSVLFDSHGSAMSIHN
ncbi:MAG TPA: hypothetical protein VE035_11475, partial [Puia sp.]|nr:hypothetical protein [Puia sp.]